MFRTIVFAVFIISLSACSTTEDPRKGGFFSGVANIESGAYERRVESLKQRANRAREENIRLAERNEQLSKQRDAGARYLAKINADISRTSQQMNVLRRQITSKETGKNASRAELARIKGSIEGINTEINRLKTRKPVKPKAMKTSTPSSVSPDTIRQLEKRKKELHDHYISLLELLSSQL